MRNELTQMPSEFELGTSTPLSDEITFTLPAHHLTTVTKIIIIYEIRKDRKRQVDMFEDD